MQHFRKVFGPGRGMKLNCKWDQGLMRITANHIGTAFFVAGLFSGFVEDDAGYHKFVLLGVVLLFLSLTRFNLTPWQ